MSEVRIYKKEVSSCWDCPACYYKSCHDGQGSSGYFCLYWGYKIKDTSIIDNQCWLPPKEQRSNFNIIQFIKKFLKHNRR